MKLEGKKALVTGASRGIGRAIALAYATEGADVAVTGRNMATLEPVAAEIRAMGRKAVAMAWDVSEVKGMGDRLAETAERLGGLDILVNNAGALRRPGSQGGFLELAEEDWDYVMDTNLKGLYFLCQAAARFWIAGNRGGCVVNIASEAGLGLRGETAPYGLSKSGVIGLTKGIAKLLYPKGIRVVGIAPGCVTTEMLDWKPGKPVESGPPWGRMSYPEEIADLALFLASDQAARVAGDTVVIGGGLI